jgi:fumarate reductase subunit C
MDWSSQIIADAGLGERSRKSRWPARLDVLQSLSGLALALSMWGHMFFVSSILISKDATWTITKMFEGYFLFGRAYPWIVSIVVGCVFALFIGHALLALRKFPINYRQFPTYRGHMQTDRIRATQDGCAGNQVN